MNLGQTVKTLSSFIHEKESNADMDSLAEQMEQEKVSVTVRISPFQFAYLDLLSEKTGMSRSALLGELGTSALFDAVGELDLTDEFQKVISKKLLKEKS